jgi:integrase
LFNIGKGYLIMARGSIIKRCKTCRREGRNQFEPCNHSERVYAISYRVGKKSFFKTIGPNKKEAEAVLAKTMSEVNNGTFHQADEITLNDFIDKWLDEHAAPRIKANTLYKYKNALKKHVRPKLGHQYLSKISQNDIRALMSKMIKIKSAKTCNNILTMLKTIFKYARLWGYIRISPTEDVDKFRVERQEMDFLRPDEINLLLEQCREPFKTFLLTAVLTGMRKVEFLGLQWGDVDWNSNTIFVKRSLKYQFKNKKKSERRWYFDTPKTKYSARAITMSPKLKEALEIHRITSPVNETDLVFVNSTGSPLDPDNIIKREFQPALRMAGLRLIRFHDLRHTYTSLLIAQGENIKFIQSQLGHASIQTTLDRYGHILPNTNRGAGKRLDKLVFGEVTSDLMSQTSSIAE